MTDLLRLTVLTPGKTLLDTRGVAWVKARLTDGAGIGIWPLHAPLVAETVRGRVNYADEAGEHSLDLEAGILQVDGDGVTILTSSMSGGDAPSDGTGAEGG
jgi:F0F1-type ATP synthase epsilon subunit